MTEPGWNFFDFQLPAFFIALTFACAAAAAGAYPMYRCGLELRDAGIKTRLPATLLALLFFLVAPVAALYFGATYSIDRSSAILVEREITSKALRDLGFELGMFPDGREVEIGVVRDRLRRRLQHQSSLGGRPGRPEVLQLKDAIDDEYARALDAALDTPAGPLTWRTLAPRVRDNASPKPFEEMVRSYRRKARKALLGIVVLVAGLGGGSVLVVRWICRRRRIG